ncbi:MAG TPA: CapA family protein [Anaerolineae bacterium]|nr:CapA family protein [Anaerolineae bacterium]HIQ08893.1 CapA family protein [Anaerolineaceae bacterium]
MRLRTLFPLFALLLLLGCRPTAAAKAPWSPSARSADPSPTLMPWPPLPPTPTFLPTQTPTVTPTPSPTPTPTPSRVTFLFVGNIVPARCVRAAADQRGDDRYIYAEVAPLIRQADYAFALLNSALTSQVPPTGCMRTFLLVGDPAHAATMAWAGFDAVNVATNHIKNGGDGAFLDTLEALRGAGLAVLGGGRNVDEALQPLVLTFGGVRYAFVALNEIEERSFAGQDTPGAAPLTEANLQKAMQAARAQADVVVALPHWGPEYHATPLYEQRRWARRFVEAGADVVVGNHSHVVQGMTILDNVPVFYSLGNFVFDQSWSLETQQGAMLELTFEGRRLVAYRFIPVHTDGDGTVHLAPPDEAQAILQRIWAASPPLATPTWEAGS